MPGSRRPTDPSFGPSRGFTTAVALFGLVAVGLVVVLVYAFAIRPDTPPTAAAPATTNAPSSATGPSSSTPTTSTDSSGDHGRPPGCTTTGIDQTVPTTTPTEITWTLEAGVAAPSSATDGPVLRADAGVGYCYSHTPLGALLAASNVGRGTGTAQALQDASVTWALVANEYTAAGAAQAAPADAGSTNGSQLGGFRFINYSPDQASIVLAYSKGADVKSYGSVTLALQWFSGDWRVVPQPGPSIAVTASALSSLAGFVPWAGIA